MAIKPSHIAAAKLKVAIANKTGRNVPEWIRQLAERDLTVRMPPRQSGDSAPDRSLPESSASTVREGAGARQASADPDSIESSPSSITATVSDIRQVPVIGRVAAGRPEHAGEDEIE